MEEKTIHRDEKLYKDPALLLKFIILSAITGLIVFNGKQTE